MTRIISMKKVIMIMLAAILAGASLTACAASDEKRSTGQVIDDSAIAAKTKAALAEDEVTDAIDIDVEVDKAHVQLNGFVDTDAQRIRADEIAKSIEGVVAVENNLEVSGGSRTAGEYVDDKAVLAKVKTALAGDPVAHALKIDVEVNRGVVSLGGHVDSVDEANAAVEAARSVKGVQRVINNLDVR